MRVRICRQPAGAIDGMSVDHFRPGLVYDVRIQLASVFLAEGWAEPADPHESGPTTEPSGRVAAIVLVVDDDTDLRKMTVDVLACNGYGVIEAQHGREGIARLVQDTPDLVVLDLNMPVMDGWEFRAEQRRLLDERLTSIPAILVTGADGAAEHSVALQAVGVVEKPFDPERLLAAITTDPLGDEVGEIGEDHIGRAAAKTRRPSMAGCRVSCVEVLCLSVGAHHRGATLRPGRLAGES